jgi:50S ribosomal subunit-associated GTPase HflX
MLDQMKDHSFSEEKFESGNYELSEDEKKYMSSAMPQILVLNKVDLVSNKLKFREL